MNNDSMRQSELFTHIWDTAYEIFAETDDILMWDYLKEQISNGNISRGDAEEIAGDVIETYNL